MYFSLLFHELDITTLMTVKIHLLQARPLICDLKHNYTNSIIENYLGREVFNTEHTLNRTCLNFVSLFKRKNPEFSKFLFLTIKLPYFSFVSPLCVPLIT